MDGWLVYFSSCCILLTCCTVLTFGFNLCVRNTNYIKYFTKTKDIY